jgi:FMN-binding protein
MRPRRLARRAAAQVFVTGVLLLVPPGASARVFLSQQQALEHAFPSPRRVERRSLFLSEEQARRIGAVAAAPVDTRVIPYYVGLLGDRVDGYAYFDTHLVRTLPETILVLLSAEGRIVRIEILSFEEPEDYLPPDRWLAQFPGHGSGDDLSPRGDIRSLTGATISARAITEAARRVLATHRLLVATPGTGTPAAPPGRSERP